MIGLPRDAAQKTHCFPTAKASTGMQYRPAGNLRFAAYLYRKSSNARKAPACRLTLRWEFRNGRQRVGLDRHQTEMRIIFLSRDHQLFTADVEQSSARYLKPTKGWQMSCTGCNTALEQLQLPSCIMGCHNANPLFGSDLDFLAFFGELEPFEILITYVLYCP